MEPLARYPLRTRGLYWVVLGALVAMALVVVGLALPALIRFGPRLDASGFTLLLAALLAALPILYWFTTAAYRAPGGHAELRLFRDRLELHAADALGPRVLPLAALQLHVQRVVVRLTMLHLIPVADLERGSIVTLRGGGQQLVFSSLLLDDPRHLDGLLEDIRQAAGGGQPAGPRIVVPRVVPPGAPPAEAHRKYEEQLDRELDELD